MCHVDVVVICGAILSSSETTHSLFSIRTLTTQYTAVLTKATTTMPVAMKTEMYPPATERVMTATRRLITRRHGITATRYVTLMYI